VFVGHVHRYQVFERNGTQYYQLATTGGGSRLRGQEFGEFDHVAWITMKKETPVITQVMLDGILPANLKIPESDEKGVPVKKRPTQPVSGKLTIDGKEAEGVTVTFHAFNENTEKYNSIADGLTDKKGQFQVSTYGRFDGCPVGEYMVTVVKTGKGYYDAEANEKNQLPEKYSNPKTSPLKITIKEGANDVNLEMTTK
jgi:serine/threonine-protein phosphatase CPPED1